jgi:uracil-DNA glycosylase family 4
VVGEGPGREECEQNSGFVGQSGELLWPLVERFAGVRRVQCWVTNVSKHRLDDTLPSDKKLTPAEFVECRDELLEELTWIARPQRVLAVGSIAARALMGDAFTTMDACNGMVWRDEERGWTVVPCFHPAAALRGGGESKLGWTARAIEAWREDPVVTPTYNPRWVAIDTEGWPDDPIMLTWAWRDPAGQLHSGVVYPTDVPKWWQDTIEPWWPGNTIIVYHNALWDWRVIEAMGVREPWRVPFEDTMERAYVRTCEPQGLKALAWKHLGVRMRDYDDVVRPHWEEVVKAYAEGFVAGHTRTEYRKLKRGGVSKVGKIVVDDVAKPIKRVLANAETLAERLGFPGPSLRFVPREEAEAYAVEDAVMTLRLREVL